MAKGYGCFCTTNGTTWKGKTEPKNGAPSAPPEKHAEQQAFDATAFGKRDQSVYALVQNDFPCFQCKKSFLDKSLGNSILFIITENKSEYWKDCGFTTVPPIPQVIYLKDGKFKIPGYVTTTTVTKQPRDPANPHTKWETITAKATNLVAINESPLAPAEGHNPDNEAGPTRPAGFPNHPSIANLLLSTFT